MRRVVSIVSVVLCAVLLAGFFVWTRSFRTEPSEYASAAPVEGGIWEVQPTENGLDWTLHNGSGTELLLGPEMALECQQGDGWEEVLTRLGRRASERAYTAIGWPCSDGESIHGTFSLWEYPALRAGTYRLVIRMEEGQALFSQPFVIS